MRAPDTTGVVPNGSHYRDSRYTYCLADTPLALLVHGRVYACCVRAEESYRSYSSIWLTAR